MSEDEPEVVLLPQATPQVPIVLVDDRAGFQRALDDVNQAHGPLAVDAERASGFRYSQRAYLVQVHRAGSANYLIDPIGVGDLSDLTAEFAGIEWIIHAAHQDLPCLREVGVDPQLLFDTELGARLAGLARVGLQGVVEDVLGMRLAKEHSAADWSTRPLPESWLTYAALDVELLPRVRNAIHDILADQNKLDIAREEFDAQLSLPSSPTRTEPWRRLSGLHQVRGPRKLALARELWETRDAYAQEIDTAPGRLVPDRSLVAAVMADPPTKRDLAGLKEFHGRASRSQLDRWWNAIERGRATEDLPAARTSSEGPPPPRIWAEKRPEAWARLQALKEALATLGEELSIPAENLLTPDFVRRLCWDPPADNSVTELTSALVALGARQWQISLVMNALVDAFVAASQQTLVPPGPGS